MGISFLLSGLISNRLLRDRVGLPRKLVRFPIALAAAGTVSYLLNLSLLRRLYENDLKENRLDKYYSLDLDAGLMQEDLSEMGINIT